MKRNRFYLLVIFSIISLLIVSCSPGKVMEPTATITPANTPIPTATSTPTPTPTPIGSGAGGIVYAGVASLKNDNKVWDIFSNNIHTKELVNLTHNENSSIRFMSPQYSPDGKKIAFMRGEINYGLGSTGGIFLMDSDGNNIQRVSPSLQYQGNEDVSDRLLEQHPVWSPDGKKIAFTSNRASYGDDTEIFIIDMSSFEITQITKAKGESMHPTWAPDGKKIAFMSNRYGDWDLFIVDIEKEELFQLTSSEATERFPMWSHDGAKIIFHSDYEGNVELYTIEPDGSNLSRVTTNPASDQTASWSPDDGWIVFQSDRDGDYDIYMMKLDGSEENQLTSNDTEDITASWAP